MTDPAADCRQDLAESNYLCAVNFLNRARYYAAKGDDENALANFNIAIGAGPILEPTFLARAYHGRGLIFLKRREYEKSLDDFGAALHNDRVLKEAYRSRAEALFLLERFEEALIDANRALWIAPFYAAGYIMRARIYGALGRTSDAMADNAHVGALFVPSLQHLPGTEKALLYPAPAVACSEDDKYLVQIKISRGGIVLQPVSVGTSSKVTVWRDNEDIALGLGNVGCRVTIGVGKSMGQASRPEDVKLQERDVKLSLKEEPPLYAQVIYKEPVPECADAKLTIRVFWGIVEFQDNYQPPIGTTQKLGLVREYGSDGCRINVQVSKVD